MPLNNRMNALVRYATIFVVIALSACTSQTNTKKSASGVADSETVGQVVYSEELSGTNADTLSLALAALGNEDAQEAKRLLSSIKSRRPIVAVETNLALADLKLENFKDAHLRLANLAASSYADSQIHNLYGLSLVEIGKIQEAEQAYIKSISMNPKNYLANFNLALLYDVYYQDITAAREQYLKYLALIPYEDSKTQTWVEELERSL